MTNTPMMDPNQTQIISGTPSADPNKTVMGAAPTIHATVTIKPVQCPICKTFNPPGMMFCTECGLIFDRALPADAFGAPAVQLPVLVDGAGREHPLRPGANVLGRQGDVMIEDSRISRRHAQLTLEGDVLTLEDLGSTNGTQHNGKPANPSEKLVLKSGDKISLGGYELTLSLPSQATKTAMALSGKTSTLEAVPTTQIQAAAYLVGPDGFERSLKAGENTFGRKDENDVQIPDPYVSGKHGTIEVTEEGIYLTDIGSSNGTLLNEAKLTPNMRTKLEESDTIRLGSLEFQIKRATG